MKATARDGAWTIDHRSLFREGVWGGSQSRIDVYAHRANQAAWDRGLSGLEAGAYVDRYLGKAVSQLDNRLVEAGSEYRAISQYGRNARGVELAPYNRPAGSKFLDVALTNESRTTVYSGWDVRFQSTPYPRWNSAADNAAYINRFQIQEGFVREIGVAGRRP